MRSVLGQSVKFLHALITQVETQLLDHFGSGLEVVYAGSKPTFPYKSTQIYSVGATTVNVHGPTTHNRCGHRAPFQLL